MKRKNPMSENATKKDIRILENSLKRDMKIFEGSLRGEMHEMRGEIKSMREEHKQYRDEVLTKFDEVMGELGVMREENTIGSGQTSQLREEVENHEKRIQHLEKIPQTA